MFKEELQLINLSNYDFDNHLRHSSIDDFKTRLDLCSKHLYFIPICYDCGSLQKVKTIREGVDKFGNTTREETFSYAGVQYNCNLRYCSDPYCLQHRYSKSFRRLESYGIWSRKLLHFSIDFPFIQGSEIREAKKLHIKIMRKFWNKLKKLSGYRCKCLRIMDLKKKPLNFIHLHYHFAMLPEATYDHKTLTKRPFDMRKFLMAITFILDQMNNPFVFENHKFTPKYSLYSYFSKRMAGLFGDGNQTTTLDKIMSLEQYITQLHRSRMLVGINGFPERSERGLAIIRTVLPEKCSDCGSNNIGFERSDLYFMEFGDG